MSATPVEQTATDGLSLAIGDQLYRQGDYQTALVHYIAALESEPDSADILFRIGVTNDKLGNTKIAINAFKKALTITPTHPGANEGLGLGYLSLRQYDEARAHLIEATKAGSGLRRAENALGILADLDRNHSEAKNHFIAASGGSDAAVTNNNIGYSQYLMGDWTAAERSYRTALAHNSEFERALNNLGLLYVRKGEYSNALDIFTRSMSTPEAYNNIGYFNMLDGKHDDAERFFQRAIDESPRYYARAQHNLLRNAAEKAMRYGSNASFHETHYSYTADQNMLHTEEAVIEPASFSPVYSASSIPQPQVPEPREPAVADFPEGSLICRVAADVLRVRKNTDAASQPLAALYKDQEVAILLERNEWVQISYLNSKSQKMRKGWINSDYLQGDEQSTRCGALGDGRFEMNAELYEEHEAQPTAVSAQNASL